MIDKYIARLRIAAEAPIKNYKRILSILDKVESLNKIASLPQNSEVRPRIAAIVKKIAGVFAEVDSVHDLDKPLTQIEKAIASIYKDQSSNTNCFFERKGLKNHPIRNNYDQ